MQVAAFAELWLGHCSCLLIKGSTGMLRISVLCVIASLLPSLSAAESCTLRNKYCVPFIGCTLDGKDYFMGRTYGKRSGPIIARSWSGAECKGRWWRTVIGTGKAEFSCTDGNSGRATYNYVDSASGTVLGRGRLASGDRMRFWAGHKVLPYVLEDEDEREEMIACVSRALKDDLGTN